MKTTGKIIICSLLAYSLLAQHRVQEIARPIDLTVPEPEEAISNGRGVPGFSNTSPITLLPLIVKLEAVERAVQGRTGVNILLALQNVSGRDFELPVGRDVQIITSPGRKQRRTFAFMVRALFVSSSSNLTWLDISVPRQVLQNPATAPDPSN